MDTGSMLNQGRAPVGYMAYERSYLGWLTIPEIDSPQGVVLGNPHVEGSVPAVLYRNPNNDNEYFIFENKQQGTWFTPDLGSGLLVTRIAYLRNDWNLNVLNNVKAMKRACALTADNSKLYYTAAQSNLYGNALVNRVTWPFYNGDDCTSIPVYKVMKHSNGTISFNIMGNDPEYTYKPTEGTEYQLVSDASLLESGDTIVIVNVADAVALGKTQTNERRIGACVNVIDDNTILAEDNIQELVLKKTANGFWALMAGDVYLTAATTGQRLISTSKPNNLATATISIEEGNAVIQFQTNNVNKNIRYDAETTSFSCFNDQADNIRIYAKKATDGIAQVTVRGTQTPVKGVYTITGQHVGARPHAKGIYIVDGKKVVVK